jgi:hypothetical protein
VFLNFFTCSASFGTEEEITFKALVTTNLTAVTTYFPLLEFQ